MGITEKRIEQKYLLTYDQYRTLLRETEGLLEDDEHARGTVSSLYFDTPDLALAAAEAADAPSRQKLRIRAYGACAQADLVYVELKSKRDGVTRKHRVALAAADAMAFLSGQPYLQAAANSMWRGSLHPDEALDPQVRANAARIEEARDACRGLAPRIMTVVDRVAKRSADGSGVRVTFDLNSRWRATRLGLGQAQSGTLTWAEGRVLVEVKSQGALPTWLVRALAATGARPQSASKVGLAYEALTGRRAHDALHCA